MQNFSILAPSKTLFPRPSISSKKYKHEICRKIDNQFGKEAKQYIWIKKMQVLS